MKKGYLEATFDEMETTCGTIENTLAEILASDAAQQQVIHAHYLGHRWARRDSLHPESSS